MWGFAQIKYTNENSWSRGVVSLHTNGWVHLITYPRETQGADMVMMTYPATAIEHVEWLEVRLNPFDREGAGLRGAKELLDKYRQALYPDMEGGEQPPMSDAAQQPSMAEAGQQPPMA